MKTAIEWTEYDWTLETLPDGTRSVLYVLSGGTRISTGIRAGDYWRTDEWQVSIRPGDLWAYSPVVERGRES